MFLVVLLPDGDTQWHPLIRKRPTPLWVGLGWVDWIVPCCVGTCRAGGWGQDGVDDVVLMFKAVQGRGGDTKDYPVESIVAGSKSPGLW